MLKNLAVWIALISALSHAAVAQFVSPKHGGMWFQKPNTPATALIRIAPEQLQYGQFQLRLCRRRYLTDWIASDCVAKVPLTGADFIWDGHHQAFAVQFPASVMDGNYRIKEGKYYLKLQRLSGGFGRFSTLFKSPTFRILRTGPISNGWFASQPINNVEVSKVPTGHVRIDISLSQPLRKAKKFYVTLISGKYTDVRSAPFEIAPGTTHTQISIEAPTKQFYLEFSTKVRTGLWHRTRQVYRTGAIAPQFLGVFSAMPPQEPMPQHAQGGLYPPIPQAYPMANPDQAQWNGHAPFQPRSTENDHTRAETHVPSHFEFGHTTVIVQGYGDGPLPEHQQKRKVRFASPLVQSLRSDNGAQPEQQQNQQLRSILRVPQTEDDPKPADPATAVPDMINFSDSASETSDKDAPRA